MALYICKRALYIRKIAVYVSNSALYMRKRALYIRICKRALYISKSALYMRKKALYIRKRALYMHALTARGSKHPARTLCDDILLVYPKNTLNMLGIPKEYPARMSRDIHESALWAFLV